MSSDETKSNSWWRNLLVRHDVIVASIAAMSIVCYLVLRFIAGYPDAFAACALLAGLIVGGIMIVAELGVNATRGEFGADWLAGIAIVTSFLLGEYLTGVLVVLMLSGGEAIESYAIAGASSVLAALAKRMPSVAHFGHGTQITDVPIASLRVGDELTVFPHEICPIDGVVIEGHGTMDESFLTGEPYQVSKAPGASVISGALNGETAIVIRAVRKAIDSRYSQIMKVMEQAEQNRPRMRRIADRLGAAYTPLALAIAGAAWWFSGDSQRFLAVLVVATPCPLLIAIPVAILGAISLCARCGIIVRNPSCLERIGTCRTLIFDKTGTLTYGRPTLIEEVALTDRSADETLTLAASLERYSKHPLAPAILDRAKERGLSLLEAAEITESPGTGLRGIAQAKTIQITSRNKWSATAPKSSVELPAQQPGLECLVLIDDRPTALYRFRDAPRTEGGSFIRHLAPRHGVQNVMIISGDREQEVRYLANEVGIERVYAEKSPEEKLTLVTEETRRGPTIYVGDGINDAPALTAATVGIAFGRAGDITSEAADAVILESSLLKVDQFLHIGARMRAIALQSAVGGMAVSLTGMGFAAFGLLTPVVGAILQEVIDVVAVFNAVRVGWTGESLSDFDS